MEEITVILTRENFDFLTDNDLLKDHQVKEVYVKDEKFKDDPVHKELVKRLIKAREAVKEYEFKVRNKIA